MKSQPNLIRYYRKLAEPKQLTQADLATALGVAVNTIGNWEKEGVPDESSLLRLIEVFANHHAILTYDTAKEFWECS